MGTWVDAAYCPVNMEETMDKECSNHEIRIGGSLIPHTVLSY